MLIGNLKLPINPLILAPMEGVTEMPFRLICKRFGADLVYTEFVASEALIRDVEKSLNKIKIDKNEKPVAVQIFGGNVSSLVGAAEKVLEVDPDIIDINSGCPVKKVVNKGGGAALMKTPDILVESAAKIVELCNSKTCVNIDPIPVTVKLRLGWNNQNINVKDIIYRLQDVGVSAVTIHGRTRSQMYKGEANWGIITEIKNDKNIFIPIIGNGDIDSAEKAYYLKNKSNVDGLMIGRAAIGNPWIFKQIKHFLNTNEILSEPSLTERVDICTEHFLASLNQKEEYKAIIEMRHHYARYFKGVKNFKTYKMQLMSAVTTDEVLEILNNLEDNLEIG